MYVYIPAYQKTYDITIHLIASWPWTPTLKNETSPLSQVLCIAMYIGFAFFFAGFKDTTKSSLLEEHDDEVSFFSSESRGLFVANSAMKWGASKTKTGTNGNSNVAE